ncbi:MAG: substrate-binding domain-containing protein [Cytophagales bacterium]|nr:substrate-binding domain-containing protein [Cytophagales bacterium]
MSTPHTALKGLSSLATKHVLLALAAQYQHDTGTPVNIETIGGVDAAKRVAASGASGEAIDLIFLGSDAIDQLIAAGHVRQGSRVDWVKSTVAVAVRSGAAKPDIGTEDAVKAAVIAAPSISYSTGPSGVYLAKLFARWGIADEVHAKLVQAPSGVPVGSLVASGRVALGFQQLSELLGMDGIDVLGNLPEAIACITTFSSGIPTSRDAAASQLAQGFQSFLAAKRTEAFKQKYGMYWV